MTEVRDHILRLPLPWRASERLTECGHAADEFISVLTYDAFLAKFRSQGQQRAALSTCMTCWQVGTNHQGMTRGSERVKPDLMELVLREVQRAIYGRPSQLRDELTAMTLLVEAHPDEFAEYVQAVSEQIRFADLARKRSRV